MRFEDIRTAVWHYICAMRATGRTKVNTFDIAVALDLPEETVRSAASTLEDAGVKILADDFDAL